MIKAVIFDMDGVLLDSEYAMRKAAILALQQWGVTAKHEDFMPFTGAGEDRFVGGVAELYGATYVTEMKAKAYKLYIHECLKDIVPFENIPEMFEALWQMELKTAVASAADRIKVDANLKAIGVPEEKLDAVITGSDVTRKKPNPDAFLLAAETIGVQPEDCLVIEDAVNGIKAAVNAGMKSVGILSSFSPEELTAAGADALLEKTCNLPGMIANFT